MADARSTQQTALRAIGDFHANRGDHAQALAAYARWVPDSFRGNGAAQFAWERDVLIARELVALGRVNEALKQHLEPHLAVSGGELYGADDLPVLAVDLHAKRGTLGQFIRWLKPRAVSKWNVVARRTLELAQARAKAK